MLPTNPVSSIQSETTNSANNEGVVYPTLKGGNLLKQYCYCIIARKSIKVYTITLLRNYLYECVTIDA